MIAVRAERWTSMSRACIGLEARGAGRDSRRLDTEMILCNSTITFLSYRSLRGGETCSVTSLDWSNG